MNAGGNTLLSVSSAHIVYGKVEAVRSVSLDVATGEIVTIIGANGAGKTTLLNAIMGILPLKGGVIFAGQDMARLDIEDRVAAGLSLVPEHRELFGVPDRQISRGAVVGARLHAVSAVEGASQATGGNAVRRRAADAGDGPRLDGGAQAVDAG